jgi:bacteriophage N4 adsorption protein B
METLHSIFLIVATVAAVGFLIFGIDDVFFDLQFLRHLRGMRKKKHVTLSELRNEPEQLIAVMIPAWQEAGVIERMAEHASRTLAYDRYDIFIGVYPNDPETSRAVDNVARTLPRIHKVVCGHPGPTSKADCLNAIHRAVRDREIPGRREYTIMALHDAEDILHPLTLKVYNHHVPSSLDMGQLPVFPLEATPWRHWVRNTYLDEFAEWHVKDMFSREKIGGVVPSAGVGTAFSRRAIDHLAARHGGDPFPPGNLAEDYMVALELSRAGFRTGFLDHAVSREAVKRDKTGRVRSTRKILEKVAVRENFPGRFTHAVKQKARWIIGTAFQGWQHAGWWGTPAVRYTLFRDRRAPVVHCVNAAGYCVIAYVAAEFTILQTGLRNTMFLPPLFQADGLLWRIVLVDMALLVYRVGQKVSCVSDVYGLRQGLFAIPRYPVVNVLNMTATLRAGWLYLAHRITGKPLAWTKTTHVFPGREELVEFTRSVEDLLVDDGIVTRSDLEKALAESRGRSAPAALLDMRLIDEDQFISAWSRFSGLRSLVAVPEDVDGRTLDTWPEEEALSFRAIPLGDSVDGSKVFAFVEPPGEGVLKSIAETEGARTVAVLIRPTNFTSLRNEVYGRGVPGPAIRDPFGPFLGTLDTADRRRVREFAMLRRRPTGEAVAALGLLAPAEVRVITAEWLDAEPVDFSKVTLGIALLNRLGPLFCEVHGLLPLNNGALGIMNPVHPAVEAMIGAKLGFSIPFCADTPEAFLGLWNDMARLGFAQDALLRHLVEAGAIDEENAARVRSMQRLVEDPVDRLLLQLGMVSRERVDTALRATSGLEAPEGADGSLDGEGLLAPGFPERTGIAVRRVRDTGITLRLSGIPRTADIREIAERFAGTPLEFQLPPLKP